MRLIDADAITFRKEFGDMSDNPKMFVFKDDIANLPTIDPASLRPKGEWSGYEMFLNFPSLNGYCCSNCYHHEGRKTGFCPNCGADMRPKEADT